MVETGACAELSASGFIGSSMNSAPRFLRTNPMPRTVMPDPKPDELALNQRNDVSFAIDRCSECVLSLEGSTPASGSAICLLRIGSIVHAVSRSITTRTRPPTGTFPYEASDLAL